MALTVADFRIRFPEFSDNIAYPDARIQLFIDDATDDIDEAKFRPNIAKRLLSYLSAHYLELASNSELGDSSSSGPLSSHSEGEVSTSYAVNAADGDLAAYYGSTIYGQKYLTLLRTYGTNVLTAL